MVGIRSGSNKRSSRINQQSPKTLATNQKVIPAEGREVGGQGGCMGSSAVLLHGLFLFLIIIVIMIINTVYRLPVTGQ